LIAYLLMLVNGMWFWGEGHSHLTRYFIEQKGL